MIALINIGYYIFMHLFYSNLFSLLFAEILYGFGSLWQLIFWNSISHRILIHKKVMMQRSKGK